LKWVSLAGLVWATLACGGHRAPHQAPSAESRSADVGIYRATLLRPGEDAVRFRAMVFAELPDRLHAEVLGPIGGVVLVIDAGAGRLAVTVPQQRLTFVGEANAGNTNRVVGIPLAPSEMVEALLVGELARSDVEVRREPARNSALPRKLDVSVSGTTLRLELRTVERASLGRAAGTGTPPPGAEPLRLDSAESQDILLRALGHQRGSR
jgi:hypothetical protein